MFNEASSRLLLEKNFSYQSHWRNLGTLAPILYYRSSSQKARKIRSI